MNSIQNKAKHESIKKKSWRANTNMRTTLLGSGEVVKYIQFLIYVRTKSR